MSTVLASPEPALQPTPTAPRGAPEGLGFAATILVSAFLLFQVQPLLSKFILPWFGGSPAVWTTAMLFFQVVLFAGYSYAHLLHRFLAPRGQLAVHVALLIGALCLLPVVPSAAWKPVDSSEPTWRILALLATCVGLPYLVLSATGPLVQAWFSRVYPQTSPYRLYALSNVGSLAALLSYPFYFEGAFDTTSQAYCWSAGFALFAVLCAACAVRMARAPAAAALRGESQSDAPLPAWRTRALWLALPALASAALLATTNHVCQDVAVIPFLWVVPLALYLLTFIIAFDHERWYRRGPMAAAAAILLFLAGTISACPITLHFTHELVLYFGALFLLCMLCHGELVRLKPAARHLTAFYLMISAGGALGGIFVSLIAPLIFSDYVEWPITLVSGFLLAVGLFAWYAQQERSPQQNRSPQRVERLVAGWGLALLALVGTAAMLYVQRDSSRPVAMARSFYGVASVYERAVNDPPNHDFALFNGSIVHGTQFVASERRNWPTTYYGRETGVGRALEGLRRRGPLRVGTVGLGVGTLATYARPQDHYVFYEINPDVERLARRYFTYLDNAGKSAEVVLGDARISLERESPRQFDLLVLDAFSGDAIPAHLLTAEAFDIYCRHLDSRHGTLAIHITNHYLDLAPVVRGLAERSGFATARVQTESGSDSDLYHTDWVILSRDPELIAELRAVPTAVPVSDREIVWTDARSNLFEILK